ncbi:MCP four helix bundle domain-containing protein [Cohnella sp. WQ 127256]|uniref:MCP four helix bundle domain-containing protein n=1 Tax=Cohnella sp. WQ 127256 TaxID=2938790 RepID=UPI0021198A32|nr:MCP four helix bundle domain-containing protein [Cohnella sp. WQ 127256]
MNVMRDMKFRGKLISIILVGIAFVLLVSFIGSKYIEKTERNEGEIYKARLLSIKWAGEASLNFHVVERNTKELMLATDTQEIINLQEEINKLIVRNDELLEMLRAGNIDSYQKDKLSNIKEATDVYRPERKKVEIMAVTGRDEEVYAYFQRYAKPHLNEIIKQYNALVDYNEKLMQDLLVEMRNNKVSVDFILIGSILISILLAIGFFRIASKMKNDCIEDILRTR